MLGALGRAPVAVQGASKNALCPLPVRQSSKRLHHMQGRRQVVPRAGLDFRLPHEREAEGSDLYMPPGWYLIDCNGSCGMQEVLPKGGGGDSSLGPKRILQLVADS